MQPNSGGREEELTHCLRPYPKFFFYIRLGGQERAALTLSPPSQWLN